MRIGIDARELGGFATGVGRYLAGLLQEWAVDDLAGRHEFLLYAPVAPAMPLNPSRFVTRLIPGEAGTWWEQIKLARAIAGENLDVLFAPGYTAPLRLSVPFVVTIHDLSFFAHPEWFRAREGARRRWLTRRAARRARDVLTVSRFACDELTGRLGVPKARVHVIPHGITAHTKMAAVRRKEPLVLYVGSIFNRRHVPDLIRAVGCVLRTGRQVSLDIVGDNRTYPYENIEELVRSQGVNEAVRLHAYVTNERLSELYGRAGAFVFLSEYEGFGLTPLEALAFGVPPLLLDTRVARENCGEAAEYVPRPDPALVAAAIERLLFDEDRRRTILAAAPAVLARYSWPRAARATLAVLEGAARQVPSD
jgi:glycosyltransferase involved in cell wall biosynthesis